MTATAAATAPMPPAPASKNHRSPVPPTNISTAPMPRIRTVPERWGSSSISAATTPNTSAKGSTPTLKSFIRSWFRAMMWANTSTTANFAISLGCKVPSPGMTSHRLQPLYSGMKSTAVSITSDSPSTGHASLWKM